MGSPRKAGIVDVDSTLIFGKPELGVTVARSKASDLGVSVADVAETLRVSSAARKSRLPTTAASSTALFRARPADPPPSPADNAVPVSAPCPPRRTSSKTGPARRKSAPEPAAPGHDPREHEPGLLSQTALDSCQGNEALNPILFRSSDAQRAGRRAELPARVRALRDLHVSHPRGAVRELAPPGDDPSRAPTDGAVRSRLDPHLRSEPQHLHLARHSRALRRRQEELDPPGRIREPAPRARDAARRGRHPREPRATPPDPHDDDGVRRGPAPAPRLVGPGLRHAPRDRLRARGRPDSRPPPHLSRDAVAYCLRRRPAVPPAAS